MKTTVYVETTVIGYLTTRLQADVAVSGHQQTTREWWKTAANRFELLVSQLVVRECAAGDEQAAAERLQIVSSLSVLPISVEAEKLAEALVSGHAVPEAYSEDALHIAVAAVSGVEYLVTWNFRHIANATVRLAIEQVCRDCGYEPPVICTPEELLEP